MVEGDDESLEGLRALIESAPVVFEDTPSAERWSIAVHWALLRAQRSDPDQFEATWVPRLRAFGEVWARHPLARVQSASGLERWAALFPFAGFAVNVYRVESLEGLCRSKAAPQIISFDTSWISGHGNVSPKAIEAFLGGELSGLRELRLLQASNTALNRLGASPHLGALRKMDVSGLKLADHMARDSSALAGLEHLSLSAMAADDAQVLLRSGCRGSLRSLETVALSAFGPLETMRLKTLRSFRVHTSVRTPSDALMRFLDTHSETLEHLSLPNIKDGQPTEPTSPKPLAALRSLEINADGWAPYALLPKASALESLALGLGQVNTPALLDKMSAGALRTLTLSGVTLKGGGINKILAHQSLAQLERLVLRPVPSKSTPTSMQWAKSSRWPEALRALDLGQNHYKPKHIASIVAWPGLAQLKALSLSQNPDMGGEGLKAIGACANLRGLEELDLSSCYIGDDGAKHLAKGKALASLEVLDLRSCSLGSAGLSALAKSGMLAKVKRLNLAGNKLDARGLKALVAGLDTSRVTHLDLRNNKLDEKAMKILVEGGWSALEVLELGRNPLGEKGAALVREAEGLPLAARLVYAPWG